jgi:hypothetical protein
VGLSALCISFWFLSASLPRSLFLSSCHLTPEHASHLRDMLDMMDLDEKLPEAARRMSMYS